MGEEDKKLLFQPKNGQLCVKTRTQQPTRDAHQNLSFPVRSGVDRPLASEVGWMPSLLTSP